MYKTVFNWRIYKTVFHWRIYKIVFHWRIYKTVLHWRTSKTVLHWRMYKTVFHWRMYKRVTVLNTLTRNIKVSRNNIKDTGSGYWRSISTQSLCFHEDVYSMLQFRFNSASLKKCFRSHPNSVCVCVFLSSLSSTHKWTLYLQAFAVHRLYNFYICSVEAYCSVKKSICHRITKLGCHQKDG